jgi:hypothetical protein
MNNNETFEKITRFLIYEDIIIIIDREINKKE